MYKIIELNVFSDERGELIAVENGINIPFDIKRVFYIFNIKEDAVRSRHANMKASEIILCLNGCCEVMLDNGRGTKAGIKLSRKNKALYVEEATWIEISGFSKDCLLLVMSDSFYNKKDQVHDYDEFVRLQNDQILRSSQFEPAVSK